MSRARRAKLILRDGIVVEGGFFLNEGQALAPYLASRKGGWVNIVDAKWAPERETHNHAVLQVDQILIALSSDGEIPVHWPTAGASPRHVDIGLDDGTRVRGSLHLGERQRLSDYLFSCGKFLPVLGARRMPSGEQLGDIALNALNVKVVRGARLNAPDGTLAGQVAPLDPGGPRPTGAFQAINDDMVPRDSGVIEVITEGRTPDRRKRRFTPQRPAPVRVPEDRPANLNTNQAALAKRLSKHWLVRLGTQAQLLPPDPRELTDDLSLEHVWHALARRNDMADAELAVHVAWVFMLPVASLEDVESSALQIVPEKVARKLGVLPLRIEGKFLDLAVSDPTSMEIEQQLGFVSKLALRLSIATPTDIRGALDWHYGPSGALSSD
ncbi:MAG TPA: hypothetical protein VHE78_04550 [Gemmatimonadaceae bacterium]|nr:hypothetical protein [Gemmatimonadaceae bacterium]